MQCDPSCGSASSRILRTVFEPMGTSENENGAMVAVYSQIDAVAEISGAAVVIIHHSTKGSQADKSLVDIGSGASAIGRSVDTHCIVRPHAMSSVKIMSATSAQN